MTSRDGQPASGGRQAEIADQLEHSRQDLHHLLTGASRDQLRQRSRGTCWNNE